MESLNIRVDDLGDLKDEEKQVWAKQYDDVQKACKKLIADRFT